MSLALVMDFDHKTKAGTPCEVEGIKKARCQTGIMLLVRMAGREERRWLDSGWFYHHEEEKR